MLKSRTKQVWVTIGIHFTGGKLLIVAVSDDKRKGQMKGIRRSGRGGYKYDQHETFLLCDQTANLLAHWLRSACEIDAAAEIERLVNSVGHELLNLMPK